MDDSSIVDLFLMRDESAVSETSRKYGKRLYSLAYGILCDLESAEECENDTYLDAWNRIPPHEPREYLYAFLARITRHIALNLCRDRDRLKRKAAICELSAEMEECIPSPDDVECRISDDLLKELINGFLENLGVEKRKIFIRRYWYLDSVADISERYDISESKVKTTLFRCRAELKKLLTKEGYNL